MSVISAAHLVFFKAVLVTLGTVSLKPVAESVKPLAGSANRVLGFASFGTEFVNAVARNAKSRNPLQTFLAGVVKVRPQN
ncbi:MAG: hypothetical protein B9S33_06770 [Pedosphaera sp. Tous-C6FEB]|nr:MAG: hypothetical protein B9S33_06770 [Pedosphaera sp. Tous-C6FEB]